MTLPAPIRAVMFFANDPEAACRWWATHLGGLGTTPTQTDGLWWFDRSGVEVAFHPCDPVRNPVGGSPVVYWAVNDLAADRERLLRVGCTPHRGPLRVTPTRLVCQLVDPFGNTFGLDGS